MILMLRNCHSQEEQFSFFIFTFCTNFLRYFVFFFLPFPFCSNLMFSISFSLYIPFEHGKKNMAFFSLLLYVVIIKFYMMIIHFQIHYQ